MKKCISCGNETNGSIGASGLKWETICQKCKDLEDRAMDYRLKCEKEFYNYLLLNSKGGELMTDKMGRIQESPDRDERDPMDNVETITTIKRLREKLQHEFYGSDNDMWEIIEQFWQNEEVEL